MAVRWPGKDIANRTIPAKSILVTVSHEGSTASKEKRNCPQVPENPQRMPPARADRMPRSVFG